MSGEDEVGLIAGEGDVAEYVGDGCFLGGSADG
jgi:hypothetical protein